MVEQITPSHRGFLRELNKEIISNKCNSNLGTFQKGREKGGQNEKAKNL